MTHKPVLLKVFDPVGKKRNDGRKTLLMKIAKRSHAIFIDCMHTVVKNRVGINTKTMKVSYCFIYEHL